MAWMVLLLAGLSEVAWAVGLKLSAGLTRPWPTAWTVANMVLSFVLLARAVTTLPIGTAYAVWTGIGATGTALLGIALLGEPASWPRLACIGLIVAGILGLRLVAPD